MAVDEVRIRLRRKLEEMLGVNEADLLMDRPPGGWGDLVTKEYLDARFDSFERVMDARFEALEHKVTSQFHREMVAQTWRLIGAMTGLLAVVVAALRF